MKVEKALSIDEIYSRVEDYDLVLTASEALADALNNRLTRPRIGKLAYTPRSLVAREYRTDELARERDLFLLLVHELDIPWKEASFLLDEITNYWRETGGLEGFFSSSGLESDLVRRVVGLVRGTKNVFGAMEDYQVSAGTDACIVAPYQFDGLGASIFPEGGDELHLFSEEEVTLPRFRVFDSASQLVGATADQLLELEPEEVGIVVHPDSEYDSLIRSQLRARKVPFQVAENVQDSQSLRTFLMYLGLRERGDRIKVRDVKPVARALGIKVPVTKEEEYLEDAESGASRVLYELFEGSRSESFAVALQTLEDRGLQVDSNIRGLLDELRIADEPVNEEDMNNLEYYLDSFSVESRRRDAGVILVDPRSSAFVDRSVVFYLGMTSRWDSRVEEESWRDTDKVRSRNRKNFNALIQNGNRKLYMVQDRKYNREVTPSTYFNELDSGFSRFSGGVEGVDYESYVRSGPDGKKFSTDHVHETPEPVTAVSQSSLNDLAYCPRDYYFSRVVEEPDRDYFRKGTLYHDFAEFYANFPDFVEEEGLPSFVDLMVERTSSIVDDVQLGKLRTEFEIGVHAIRGFLREREVRTVIGLDYEGYSSSDGENFFAEEFGIPLERSFTEMYFRDEDVGVKGEVDALFGSEVVDYKSGRKKSSSRVVRDSNVDMVEGKPDFQALAYISHHRKVHGDKRIVFTFFHFLHDPERAVRGETSVADGLTTVTYHPYTFQDFLGREEVYDYAYSSNRKKLLDALGKDLFLQVLSRLEFEDGDFYDKDRALKHKGQLEELCKPHLRIGRGAGYDITENQFENGVTGVLKTSLNGLRTNNYFKEDVDKFESYVDDYLERLNFWRRSRFPVGENDLKDVNHRDLILAGEGI